MVIKLFLMALQNCEHVGELIIFFDFSLLLLFYRKNTVGIIFQFLRWDYDRMSIVTGSGRAYRIWCVVPGKNTGFLSHSQECKKQMKWGWGKDGRCGWIARDGVRMVGGWIARDFLALFHQIHSLLSSIVLLWTKVLTSKDC